MLTGVRNAEKLYGKVDYTLTEKKKKGGNLLEVHMLQKM